MGTLRSLSRRRIAVEEPESSLHPAAQIELAGIVAEAVLGRHLQVIISTQSPTLALAFCRLALKGVLEGKDLALWELTRDKTGTQAQQLRVDSKGLVHPRWFGSFAKAEADLLREFAQIEEEAAPNGRARKRSGSSGRRR